MSGLDPGVVATVGTALIALDLAAIGASIVNGRMASKAAQNAEQAATQSAAARKEARKAHRRLDRQAAEHDAHSGPERAVPDGGNGAD